LIDLTFMEGSPNGVADAGMLQARVAELEQELRLRMAEVTRLHRELRHARADVAVKDEYISVLSVEADKLQRVREQMGRVPYGSRVGRVVEAHLGVGPDAAPSVADQARSSAQRARTEVGRAKRGVRTRAGRLKRKLTRTDLSRS
jgi:hypothetical protein